MKTQDIKAPIPQCCKVTFAAPNCMTLASGMSFAGREGSDRPLMPEAFETGTFSGNWKCSNAMAGEAKDRVLLPAERVPVSPGVQVSMTSVVTAYRA